MDLTKGLQQALKDAQAMAAGVAAELNPDKEPVGQKPAPVKRKVLAIIYNPFVKSEGNKRLHEVMKWNDPDDLIPKHIADLKDCSYGYVNYEVVERVEVDKMPAKVDGYTYKPDEFVQFMRDGKGFHQPDAVDYNRIMDEFDIQEKVRDNKIDEAWLFAFPYAGFYESTMGGPDAFWCNSPAMQHTEKAGRKFVIMGYNYQRGLGEMLENLGHRAESILQHVFRLQKGDDHLWDRFTRYDKTHPGQAEVGWMHFAPNSLKDYDWGNKTKVKSRYHTWKNFPNLAGDPLEVDTSNWGGGDTRAHHMWWFSLIPHITGGKNGLSYNWWRYIIDPNTVL